VKVPHRTPSRLVCLVASPLLWSAHALPLAPVGAAAGLQEVASIDERLAALEEAGGSDPELWWSFLERDERERRVIEASLRWLRGARDGESRRVIDTLLTHWRVPHEALSRERYLGWPMELVEPENVVPRKLEPLLEPERSAGEAIGAELAAATSDAERLSLLKTLRHVSSDSREGALDEVAALVERRDAVGEAAREWLLATYGIGPYFAERDARLHSFLRREPITDPVAQRRLLRVARWLLDDRVEESPEVPDWDSLDLAGLCALRSEVVREVVAPRLVEILRETGEPRVFRMLCHLGVDDPLVRERYLATMRGWNLATGWNLELLPCWKHHDEETLAAFDRVFSAAPDPLALVDRLVFAGLTDAREHDLVRRFFERIEEAPAGSWYALVGRFRHVVRPEPDEPKIRQVNELGLTIATLQARGEDYAEPARRLAAILQCEYDWRGGGGSGDWLQAGFWHAKELGLRGPEFAEAALRVLERSEHPLFNHLELAAELLAEATLTPEQAARLAALPPDRGGPWPTGLRRIPFLREALYRGETQWLAELCALTPLIPRDEAYLLVLVERGEDDQRRAMLELVREHDLDSPAIRAAVASRTHDCDRRIRELAAEIVTEGKW